MTASRSCVAALKVLDTSALLAILFDEPESETIRRAIEADAARLLSAGSSLKTAFVVETRCGPNGGRELDLLIVRAGIEIAVFRWGRREIVTGRE